jgi:hypothetical protein
MKQENQCAEQIRVLPGFSQIPKICWILVREILSPKISKQILLLLCVWLSISLKAQVSNSQSLESVERNKRNTSFNLEEIKVRWKKAALENCPGVPVLSIRHLDQLVLLVDLLHQYRMWMEIITIQLLLELNVGQRKT